MDNRPNYSVPALEKGLDIVELLAESPEPLTQTQIARGVKRSSSEIFRMLNLLEARRYLVKDGSSGTYHISLKLFQLAHAHSPTEKLVQAAAAPMRELSRELGESCHLSVLEMDDLVVLCAAQSPAKIRLSVQPGGDFPPLRTVSGRLLLATLPDDRQQEWLSRSPAYQKCSRPERARLEKELGLIRAAGYALARDETVSGVVDAAVPVGSGATRAALAVSALVSPSHNKEPESFVKPLHRCARAIAEIAGI